VVAAAASYAVHADRAASTQDETQSELGRPASGSGHHRPASRAHRRKHSERRRARGGARRRARLARSQPVRTVVLASPAVRPHCAPPPAGHAPARRPRVVERRYAEIEADRKAERDVDRELQHVIDQDVPRAPAPASPAPASPAPAPPQPPAAAPEPAPPINR
jgi:hypothetical protein